MKERNCFKHKWRNNNKRKEKKEEEASHDNDWACIIQLD